MDKTQRFNKAYYYLVGSKLIKTQDDLARRMGCSRSNVSSALNGAPKVLTDNFLRRFYEAFPATFNYDWLMYDDGEMLKSEQPEPSETRQTERHAEASIVELAASLIKENEALRRDLVATINEVHRLRDEMSHDRDAIASIRSSLSAILYNSQTSQPIPMAAENEK